jgi:hypothetical protein
MEKYKIIALDKYSCYDPKAGVFEIEAEDVYDALDAAMLHFKEHNITFDRVVVE